MRAPVRREVRNKWQVSPGVKAAIWDERDARGPVRYYLLTADLRRKGLQVDFTNDGAVRRTAPLSKMLARTKHAVAGVNGDFFDIGDTGAPLGVGRDRQRGPLNGPRAGWNNAFFFDKHGHPQIDVLPMMPVVKERPKLVLTNVNSPSVRPGGVGAYNRAVGADVRLPDHRRPEPRRADGADPRGQGHPEPSPAPLRDEDQRRDARRPRRRGEGAGVVPAGHRRARALAARGHAEDGDHRQQVPGPRRRDQGRRRPRDAPADRDRDRPRRQDAALPGGRRTAEVQPRLHDGRARREDDRAGRRRGAQPRRRRLLDDDGQGPRWAVEGDQLPVRRVPALGRQRHRDRATRSRADSGRPISTIAMLVIGAKHSWLRVGDLVGVHLRTVVALGDAHALRYVAADRHRRGREPALGVAGVLHRLLDRRGRRRRGPRTSSRRRPSPGGRRRSTPSATPPRPPR